MALQCNPRLVFCGGLLDAAIQKITAPRSKWIKINHMRLNFPCRKLSRLWSGSHTSRLAQLISVILVLRVPKVYRIEIVYNTICWNLQSYRRKPNGLKGSHPMILTNPSVSVFAPWSLATATALFFALISLNHFVQYFVASLRWLQRHRQIPSTKCQRKLDLLPVLGSKLKPCLRGPRQTHRPQSLISVTAIKGRRLLTFLLSMAIGFPVSSKVHTILFPWS